MKMPFKKPYIKLKQENPADLELRKKARVLERAMTILANTKESQGYIRKELMNKIFEIPVRKA